MFYKQSIHKVALLSLATLLSLNYSPSQAAVATCTIQKETLKIEGLAGTFPYIIQRLIERLKDSSACSATQKGFYGENTLFLYGPRGNGKTSLAHAIAQTSQAEIQVISGLDLSFVMMQNNSGLQSDDPSATSQIKTAFAQAIEYTESTGKPVVILIDEINHIANNNLILAFIRLKIDEIKNNPKILVIVTSNMEPKEFDASFQSRFAYYCQLKMENPSEQLRLDVLNFYWEELLNNTPINEVTLKNIAKKTKGLPIRALKELIKDSSCAIEAAQSSVSHESILLKNLAKAKEVEAAKKAQEKAVDDEAKKWSPTTKAAAVSIGTAAGVAFVKSETVQNALFTSGKYLLEKGKDLYDIVS